MCSSLSVLLGCALCGAVCCACVFRSLWLMMSVTRSGYLRIGISEDISVPVFLARPVARLHLANRADRIQCVLLRTASSAHIVQQQIARLGEEISDTERLLLEGARYQRPCSWCGLPTGCFCSLCNRGVRDPPTGGVCTTCVEIAAGLCPRCNPQAARALQWDQWRGHGSKTRHRWSFKENSALEMPWLRQWFGKGLTDSTDSCTNCHR